MAFGFFKKQAVADIIFMNGKVYTQNPEQPWAEAVAVVDGEILAVGDTEEIMEDFEGDDTEVVDLEGGVGRGEVGRTEKTNLAVGVGQVAAHDFIGELPLNVHIAVSIVAHILEADAHQVVAIGHRVPDATLGHQCAGLILGGGLRRNRCETQADHE